jgi:outer membrane protein assembly factor BamB
MNAPVVVGRNLLINEGLVGAIFALDRFTGKEVWRVDAVPGGWFPDRATIAGDTAFVASTDTHVYALDLRDGHTYWRSSNDAGSFSAGIPCGQFVLANAFGVMAYDRATGRYLGELPTKTWRGDLYPTSHFARDDKRVYITGNKLAWSFNCR